MSQWLSQRFEGVVRRQDELILQRKLVFGLPDCPDQRD